MGSLQGENNMVLDHPPQSNILRAAAAAVVVVVVFSVVIDCAVCDEYSHDVLESSIHHLRRNIQDKDVPPESNQPFRKKGKVV